MSTISVGIDIAKEKFDAAFLCEDKSSSVRTFGNSQKGIRQFVDCLNRQGTAKTVPCVVESTGMYHLPVAFMVTNAGYRVNCINPIITKKYQRSSVRNAKTDDIDAVRLATIGLQEPNLPTFRADPLVVEVKKIVNYIARLEETKQHLLASTQALRDLEKITSFKSNLSQIENASKLIDGQIKSLAREITKMTPANILRISDEIKGISKERISYLFALIGDKTFHSRDALIAFVGLDVAPRQSGAWKGKGKLSKRGNPYARKLLFQMAWGLKQHNQLYKEKYDLLRMSGKDYKTSLIILARKLLRYLYSQNWRIDKTL